MPENMTFHESYGRLPVSTLALIGQYNVSPADFDYMTDILGMANDWLVVNAHIIANSPRGYYQPRFF